MKNKKMDTAFDLREIKRVPHFYSLVLAVDIVIYLPFTIVKSFEIEL